MPAGNPIWGNGYNHGMELGKAQGEKEGRVEGAIAGTIVTAALFGGTLAYSKYKERKVAKLEAQRLEEVLKRNREAGESENSTEPDSD